MATAPDTLTHRQSLPDPHPAHDPRSPRVDIIIPTNNRAHLIATAVQAALDQSW